MGTVALSRSTWRRGCVAAVGFIAVVSAVFGAHVVWDTAPAGQVPTPLVGGLAVLLRVAGDVVLVVTAIAAAERWPLHGRHRLRHLGVHVVVAAGASVLVALTEAGAHGLVPWSGAALTPATASQHAPGYVVALVFVQAALLARRLRRARAARTRLDQSFARAGRSQAAAELRAVKAELHPALMTDALATARGLVRDDPAAAERVVVSLGALLREAVAAADVEDVTLGEELDAALERAGGTTGEGGPAPDDAPAFAVDVESEARALLVPHLILPLLLACASDAGADPRALTVRARATRDGWGPRLVLTVVGRPDPRRAGRAPQAATSVAALGLRRRLQRLHGAAADLTVWAPASAEAASGTPYPIVRLVLPARSDDGPGPSEAPEALGVDPVAAERRGRALLLWMTDASRGGRAASANAWYVDAWPAAVLTVLLTAWSWGRAVTPPRGGALADPGVPPKVVVGGVLLAGLAAVAVFATRRWPIAAGERVGVAVRVHAAVGLVAALLLAAARVGAERWTGTPPDATGDASTLGPLFWQVYPWVVLYTVFAGVTHVMLLGGERRRRAQVTRELRTARTAQAREWAASELRALKAELNPHFVGNALHTAAALVRREPDAAARLLGALGALAEAAGAHLDTQEVPLAEEVMGLEPFLALERARLGASGGTLVVTWDVAPDALDAAVPHLVLQPLVENAVRHGLAPRGGAGQLIVAARRVGARIELSVADDGVGLRPRAPQEGGGAGVTGGIGSGAGLGGVRRRLALLYGPPARCTLEEAPGGGAVTRLTFPYRRAVSGDLPELLAAAGG